MRVRGTAQNAVSPVIMLFAGGSEHFVMHIIVSQPEANIVSYVNYSSIKKKRKKKQKKKPTPGNKTKPIDLLFCF